MVKNQLRAGVYLSYINLIISMAIPFFYTPIMLSMLGQAEYGLYSLAASAVSYLSLLSFGFGSTIIRYISKYRAENNKEAEEITYGFFLLLYCGLAIVVLLVGFFIANNVEPIFHKGLTINELAKMRVLVMIMTFNSALSFPLSIFSSMIIAHEKYIFRRCVDMLSTVAAPIANLIALYLGLGSVGMCMAATIIQFIMLPINVIYCYKKLHIVPKFKKLPPKLIKEMLGFSVFIFMGSIVDMLFWSTDKVILGMLTSSVAVAIYNVGGTFNNMIMSLSTSISGVLTPKITGMVVKNATTEELTDLFIKVGRLQFIVIALIVSGFSVFGRAFVTMWAGEAYLEAYWIAILTMFPLCIPLIQNTGLSIVIAQNKHQFRSIVYLIIAIVNAISTYFVVPTMGIIGAALCSCVAYIIGQGIVMNVYYFKVGINIPQFWKSIGKMAIIPIIMSLLGVYVVPYCNINGWRIFFVAVIIYSLMYAFLMYIFVLNDYEKDIIRKPVNKLFLKVMHRL